MDKQDLIDWLDSLPAGTNVGIDEGGLMLVTADPDSPAYLEVGGIPSDDE